MPSKKKTWHQGNNMTTPNGVFLLPPQPEPEDTLPRNAFGYLLGFGKAYAAYYRQQDEAARGSREYPDEGGCERGNRKPQEQHRTAVRDCQKVHEIPWNGGNAGS